MKTSFLFDKFVTVVLGLFFVFTFGCQLYALNKGFDITDEGYNLQLVQSKFVGISNTYFFEWVQLLFGWLPQTLLINRILSTILLLGASAWFGFTAFWYFQIKITWDNVFFCALSIPLAVSLDSITLSYNNTTALLVLLSGGCFLWVLHREHSNLKWRFVYVLLAGSFAAMVCTTKITSGLLLSISIPILFVWLSVNKLTNTLFFVLGWLTYHIVHACFFTPFYIQVESILKAGELFVKMDAHYNQYALINDAFTFIKDCTKELGVYILLLLVARFVPFRAVRVLVQAVAVGWFLYTFYTSEFQLTGLVYVSASLLCTAVWLSNRVNIDTIQQIKQHYGKIIVGIFVWALPLMVVMGTNNVYYHNYVFAGLPLAFVCVLTLQRTEQLYVQPLLMLIIGVCVVYVSYTKILFQPYRILPLSQQTETIPDGVLKGIKLDHASVARLKLLRSQMVNHGFTSSHGLICLGKMQGLQYFLEASSPGGVMFSPTFRELYITNMALDNNVYQKPYFVLSDYRFADSLGTADNNWEQRFTSAISTQMQQPIVWNLIDSVAFETAPLGKLFVYKTK